MIGYIKDSLSINGDTKKLIRLKKGKVKIDQITTANSTHEAFKVDSDINVGDILILKNNKGKEYYKGVISKIQKNQITTKQIQDIYSGSFILSVLDSFQDVQYIEQHIKLALQHYASGKLYGCEYEDPLVAAKLGSIQIESIDSIRGVLPSDKDDEGKEKYTVKDVVKWLYELYDSFGIVCEFEIPAQSGTPKLKIYKPNYSGLKITDGFKCITNITPTTEIQTTNKLVVFWSSEDEEHTHEAKEYRGTWVLTNEGIQEAPVSYVGRLNQINTKVVFSDDPIQDVVNANLNNELFNHKLEFEVDLNNKLFDYDDLKLDVPIEVYIGNDYYSTIITGKEFSYDENDRISSLKIIGGKIRNSLTQKLSLGLIKQ